MMMDMFSILTVCTGNICRSPFAERVLQAGLDSSSPGGFVVRSAGTFGMEGLPMDAKAAKKLRMLGGSPDKFVARTLTDSILAGSNLVLAMAEEHRETVVRLQPRLLKRTFTVREFAAVLEELAVDPRVDLCRGTSEAEIRERWLGILAGAQLKRHAARTSQAGKLDVVDPYQRDDSVYTRMISELNPALQVIFDFEAKLAG